MIPVTEDALRRCVEWFCLGLAALVAVFFVCRAAKYCYRAMVAIVRLLCRPVDVRWAWRLILVVALAWMGVQTYVLWKTQANTFFMVETGHTSIAFPR